MYQYLLLSGKLTEHLLEIDQTASQRVEQIVNQMLLTNPAPDKATDPIAWAAHDSPEPDSRGDGSERSDLRLEPDTPESSEMFPTRKRRMSRPPLFLCLLFLPKQSR